MSTDNDGLRDLKISLQAYNWAEAEQFRLRQITGETFSQADLFDRMRSAYETANGNGSVPSATAPASYQAMVEEFIRLLQDDSPRFRAFRDTVISVLSDRLNSLRDIPDG